MPVIADIDSDECMALLNTASFGHVALCLRVLPHIAPVHVNVTGGRVLAQLACDDDEVGRALTNAVVALQADGTDGDGHIWSVHVVGRVRSCFGAEFEVEPVMVRGQRAE